MNVVTQPIDYLHVVVCGPIHPQTSVLAQRDQGANSDRSGHADAQDLWPTETLGHAGHDSPNAHGGQHCARWAHGRQIARHEVLCTKYDAVVAGECGDEDARDDNQASRCGTVATRYSRTMQ